MLHVSGKNMLLFTRDFKVNYNNNNAAGTTASESLHWCSSAYKLLVTLLQIRLFAKTIYSIYNVYNYLESNSLGSKSKH